MATSQSRTQVRKVLFAFSFLDFDVLLSCMPYSEQGRRILNFLWGLRGFPVEEPESKSVFDSIAKIRLCWG